MFASWLTNAVILGIVVLVLPRVTSHGVFRLLLAAAVFGVLNTFLKPLMRFVTAPLALLSFGIAWFFVSMLMLLLTEKITGGFHAHGFWAFVEATIIVWAVNIVLELVPGPWQMTGSRRELKFKAKEH